MPARATGTGPLRQRIWDESVKHKREIVPKTYSLQFTAYGSGLPTDSGIYCVLADLWVPYRLIYIGEAENIWLRVATHEKRADWIHQLRIGERLSFAAALIQPATDRRRAEAAMIYRHKPPCNVEYAHHFPFPATTIITGGQNALLTPTFSVGMFPRRSIDLAAILAWDGRS